MFLFLSLFVPVVSFANSINLVPECMIINNQGISIKNAVSYSSEKLVLGFDGIDGGHYKIQVTNNGGTRWEKKHGAILLGLSRDEKGLHTRAPVDKFISQPNVDGEVDSDSRTGNPDHSGLTQFVIFEDEVTTEEKQWETEHFTIGGAEVTCTITAKRIASKMLSEDPVCPNGGADCDEENPDGRWE